MEVSDTRRSIDAVWRIESARLTAGLARVTRDLGLAEDFAQDALVAALEQWPAQGVPDNPGAWLMSVGRRRAVDHFRRQETLARKQVELGHDLASRPASGESQFEAVEEDIEDDLLRLVFTSCHPVLSSEARAALTLRVLGGLTTEEIARAFLVPESTVAQRIVRAKKRLARADVGFEVPAPADFADRLGSVLEVVYLIFNEGYAATAGEDWLRPELCHEALRLGRILASSCHASRRCTGWWRSWRSRPRAAGPGSGLQASPCCCWTRTGVDGTGRRSAADSQRSSGQSR